MIVIYDSGVVSLAYLIKHSTIVIYYSSIVLTRKNAYISTIGS